ncbi:MAG: N-acetyltransferase [Candidatus Omnitrophica bacterium]|nr:N-acetyltransferase [Candidatus Omnitrophota bacterium]
MIRKCKIAKSVKIPFPELVNLYGCEIKDGTFIGPFVEIQKGAKVGRRCRVQSHTFICEGVTVKDDVFIGHGVMFTNDLFPVANDPDWKMVKTVIEDKVSIGNNVTLLPVRVGEGSLIGAGSAVTKDVPKNTIVAGNPAKKIRNYRVRSRKSP